MRIPTPTESLRLESFTARFRGRAPQALLLVAGLVLLLVLSGCSTLTGPGSGTSSDTSAGAGSASGTSAVAAAVTADECTALFKETADPKAGELVIDNDGSRSRDGQPLPDSLVATIQAMSTKAGTVSVLAMNGADAAPRWIIRHAALNSAALGSDTAAFKTAVARSVPCVERLLARATPTTPGSNIGESLRAVSEYGGSRDLTVAVLTDGLANTGIISLAGKVVEQSTGEVLDRIGKQIPALRGDTVSFDGIAKVDGMVVSEQSASWLRSFYTQLCQRAKAASCKVATIDQGTIGTSKAAKDLPADPAIAVPGIAESTTGSTTTFRIAGSVLFAPNTWTLRTGSTEALNGIAACIASSTGTAQVDGYVNPGGGAGISDSTLSTRRAATVRTYLLAKSGVAASRIRAVGHGAADPVSTGTDAQSQALNRRVTVTVPANGGC